VERKLEKYLMVGGLLPFLGIGKGNRKRVIFLKQSYNTKSVRDSRPRIQRLAVTPPERGGG
jgi:hypothetical protein